jgi:hypothetical protein
MQNVLDEVIFDIVLLVAILQVQVVLVLYEHYHIAEIEVLMAIRVVLGVLHEPMSKV